MPKIKINGQEHEAPAGANVLKFCLEQGVYIPHYCYHPALSVAGNCRMCLVKGKGLDLRPGVMTACTLTARDPGPKQDPLEIETDSAEVRKAREGVLEFLLINHPLDCPVCDQAGECYLQDYSYEYGRDRSRFVEAKNIRHTKDVGRFVRLWGNRCILCTRCVRFCQEISGGGELNIVERGDRNIIDHFPGVPMDHLLSGNTVDICPVGALLDKEFLYQARVWYMETVDSVCPTCSLGCNLKVDTYQGAVKRMKPRANAAVNQWWICDVGRYNHKFTSAADRLGMARVREGAGWVRTGRDAAIAMVRERLERTIATEGASAVAGLASGWMSNEELFLCRKYLKVAVGAADLGVLCLPDGTSHTFKSGFTIAADRNPNRRGAVEILGRDTVEQGLTRVLDGINAGRIKAALVVGGMPGWQPPASLLEALKKLKFLAVIDVAESPLAALAHVVIPGATWIEKDGTFTNHQGRVQRFAKGLPPPGAAAAEIETLQALLQLAGKRDKVLSAQGVFGELAAEVAAYAGLTYREVGSQGKLLAGVHA